jgi:hypothetical protein
VQDKIKYEYKFVQILHDDRLFELMNQNELILVEDMVLLLMIDYKDFQLV